MSLLPITQSFEAKSNVKITQAAIDEANSTLAARATEYGMTFIDIADAFKDESGYLNTDVSTGGYTLIITITHSSLIIYRERLTNEILCNVTISTDDFGWVEYKYNR